MSWKPLPSKRRSFLRGSQKVALDSTGQAADGFSVGVAACTRYFCRSVKKVGLIGVARYRRNLGPLGGNKEKRHGRLLREDGLPLLAAAPRQSQTREYPTRPGTATRDSAKRVHRI